MSGISLCRRWAFTGKTEPETNKRSPDDCAACRKRVDRARASSPAPGVLLAKILSEFFKTQPSLEIKVGLIQGKVASPEEVKALATMPSQEVILGQVLGGIQGTANQLGAVLYNAIQQVLGIIQARVDQLGEQIPKETNATP